MTNLSPLEKSREKIALQVREALLNLGQERMRKYPRRDRVDKAMAALKDVWGAFVVDNELAIQENRDAEQSVAYSVEKEDLESQVDAELVRTEAWLQQLEQHEREAAREQQEASELAKMQASLRDGLARLKRLEDSAAEKAAERERELAAREAAIAERERTVTSRPTVAEPADSSSSEEDGDDDDEDATAAKHRIDSSPRRTDEILRDVSPKRASRRADSFSHTGRSRRRDSQDRYQHRQQRDPRSRDGSERTGDSTTRSDDSRASSALERVCESMTAQLGLPQTVLKTFNGDPSEYASFIHVFETAVESRIRDPRTRLTFLVQQCRDGAKRAIERCQLLPADEGYRRARSTLKTLYGGKKQVARACLNSLLAMSRVKDGDSEGLQQLAIELERASITLRATGYAGEANNSVTIRQVASKLPGSLTRRWIERIEKIERRDDEVVFDDLVVFAEKEAARCKISSAWAPLPVASSVVTPASGQPAAKEPVKASAGSRRRQRRKKGGEGYQDRQSTATLVASAATSSSAGSAAAKANAKSGTKQQVNAGSSSGGSSGNHASQAQRTSYPCSACGQSCRFLNYCPAFKAKDLNARRRMLGEQNRCVNCLRSGHVVSACPRDSFCLVPGCGAKHHTMMHPWQTTASQGAPAVAPAARAPVTQAVPALASAGGAFIGVLPVEVEYAGKRTVTLAVIDSGAAKTLVSRRLIDKLCISGRKAQYAIDGINERAVTYNGSQCSFKLHAYDGDAVISVKNAWEVPSLPDLVGALPTERELAELQHLSDVVIPHVEGATVNILIGTDTILAHRPLECRYGGDREPHAIRCLLGWYIQGPREGVSSSAVVNFVSIAESRLSDQLRTMYLHDFSESSAEEAAWSVEDRRAMSMMADSVRVTECNRYEVGLPWRGNEVLPPSRAMAEGRLVSLRKKLSRDPDMCRLYVDTVEEYIRDGHAEVAPEAPTAGRTWYLPHHGVTSVNKPGKVRVVFDAAAKSRGVSLNDRLLQGPDLVNELVGVLMRFREGAVAISGDIAKMFHQVRVPVADRDALRFLWWPGGDLSRPAVDHRMCVHVFGATSSPSVTTFALRRAADDQCGFSDAVTTCLKRDFYVDDCLASVDTAREASELIDGLTELLAGRGFAITKWICTDAAVLLHVPPEKRSKSAVTFEMGDQLPEERALGMRWLVQTDEFTYDVAEWSKPLTRRGVLSDVSSLFDPLGLVGPVLLPARRLLQELVHAELGWDEILPADAAARWRQWRTQLSALRRVKIPRCYTRGGERTSVQLHVFTDASETGYGACAYVRVESSEGVCVSLVMGKSRVVPRKSHTLPRLELQAAVVGAKLARHVTRELSWQLDGVHLWTDSMIVIGYLRNETRRFKTFVANRLQMIRKCTSARQWRHVSGKMNPADIASRGIAADDRGNLKLWLSGPQFLQLPSEQWPCSDAPEPSLDDDCEVKRDAVALVVNEVDGLNKVIERYSCLLKLRRIVAWWMRFSAWYRGRLSSGVASTADAVRVGALTVTELALADIALIKFVQRTMFAEEYLALSRAALIQTRSQLTPLNPQMVDGVIVVGGRLSRATTLKSHARQPVVLPARHHLTTLVVRQYHDSNGHVGVNHVLNALRQRFWVPHGRSTVRRVLGGCTACRRRKAPLMVQQMAPLLPEQVTGDQPPFTSTGVDCFGPMLVKCRRSTVKRWGCLFTCLSSRAVHVEVLSTMSAASFVCAFQRFAARRGRPKKVYSDNGSNFVGGERELREAWAEVDMDELTRQLADQHVEWVFNPAHASHRGGATERLIRSIREVLTATAGCQMLNDEQLTTLCAEAERVVNSRPLMRASGDVTDDAVITPQDLLLPGSGSTCAPPGVFEPADCYVRRWWRQAQYLADVFWRRWVREYLPTLHERQRWHREQRSLRVGDLVIMKDLDTSRGHWPLGRVTAVHPSQDGLVRSVDLKCRDKVFRRPVTQLCFLEADC